jgi:O-acetyl-ADP-ribose deacetylase (regulator of RNase III)
MSTIHYSREYPSGLKLEIAQGDLTTEAVDAIVNAANSHLKHGGGVAGAISRRGGPSIQTESDAWVHAYGPATHSRPAWTRAGSLPCKYVIHAVGPVWGQGDEDARLASAVTASLNLAEKLQCASLAIPAISTGIFGFPRAQAAKVILGALHAWAEEQRDSRLRVVRLVLFDTDSLQDFLAAAAEAAL